MITVSFLNTIEDLFSSTWIEDKAFPDFFYPVGDGIRVMSSSFIQSMKRSFCVLLDRMNLDQLYARFFLM